MTSIAQPIMSSRGIGIEFLFSGLTVASFAIRFRLLLKRKDKKKLVTKKKQIKIRNETSDNCTLEKSSWDYKSFKDGNENGKC